MSYHTPLIVIFLLPRSVKSRIHLLLLDATILSSICLQPIVLSWLIIATIRAGGAGRSRLPIGVGGARCAAARLACLNRVDFAVGKFWMRKMLVRSRKWMEM